MLKNLTKLGMATGWLALAAAPALAHVEVKPEQVGVAAEQVFTVEAPNEKDQPVVGLRLVIPEGVDQITPNVKPSWQIDVKKSGSDDNAKVVEIDWTGGSIPAGQRDDFEFSAQAPGKPTTLAWKAYQTLADGTVVSWDQTPATKGGKEDESATPYSETKIVSDLTSNNSTGSETADEKVSIYLSILAVALAVAALARGAKTKP